MKLNELILNDQDNEPGYEFHSADCPHKGYLAMKTGDTVVEGYLTVQEMIFFL